jgi:transposase
MDTEFLEQNGISKADWERTPDSVKRCVGNLVKRIAATEERMDAMQSQIAQMHEQLNRHSGNSSKPPSSDIKKVEKKLQKAKGKKRGGQSGHPGHGRFLYAVEECVSQEDCYASVCWHCGGSVTPTGEAPYRHQVVEVPPIQPEVREYRLHESRCATCGSVTRAKLPEGVSIKGYGERVVGTVAVLNGMYRLPQRWIQQAMRDLFGIELALGSINNMRHEAREAIAPAVSEAQEYVQQAPVVGADETGFRQGNIDGGNPKGKKAWLWVVFTPLVCFFQITLSRSAQSAQAVLGQSFSGIVISDRCGAYTWVDPDHRQLCWACSICITSAGDSHKLRHPEKGDDERSSDSQN